MFRKDAPNPSIEGDATGRISIAHLSLIRDTAPARCDFPEERTAGNFRARVTLSTDRAMRLRSNGMGLAGAAPSQCASMPRHALESAAMPRDPRYDILFEPAKIGPVTAKNR